MTVTLAQLNAMNAGEASGILEDCCGSSAWIHRMLVSRPFVSKEAVLSTAADIWSSLTIEDWLEAFSHHPRIGEEKSAIGQGQRGREWSTGEQAGIADANAEVKAAIAACNAEYEERFGYIYIVCASGRAAEEMLLLAQERLRNDPDIEIAIAADEQRKITLLRLGKLLDDKETQ